MISLYPYIRKYFKFPLGRPTIHVGEACREKQAMMITEDLIKCNILPPKTLYHPVLQFRSKNKLLFCPMNTCASVSNFSGECMHASVEKSPNRNLGSRRSSIGYSIGLKVLEIFELYEYSLTQYDLRLCEGSVFADYINTFLKLKDEARGYPDRVRSPEDEERYIETLYVREGVRLHRDVIIPNAAKRGLEKLRLNSLWLNLPDVIIEPRPS